MAVSWGSAVVGSSANPSLPSPLLIGDLVLAISSVENSDGVVISPPASQAAVWTQIGATTQQSNGTNFIAAGMWWARKAATNLASAAAWTNSAAVTQFTSYARILGAKRTGTPFGAVNVGFKITSAASGTPMSFGPLTPVAASTLVIGMRAIWLWQDTTRGDFAFERADALAAGPHGMVDNGVLVTPANTGTLTIALPGGSADPWVAFMLAIEEEPVAAPPINWPMNVRAFPARQLRRTR